MFGKDSRKKELINNLGNIFAEIQREHQISPGDFPDLARMQDQLQHQVLWWYHCYHQLYHHYHVTIVKYKLGNIFAEIQRQHQISPRDFDDIIVINCIIVIIVDDTIDPLMSSDIVQMLWLKLFSKLCVACICASCLHNWLCGNIRPFSLYLLSVSGPWKLVVCSHLWSVDVQIKTHL